MTSMSRSKDLEAGDTEKSEKSFLLPKGRTSSLEDETPQLQPPLGISRAHSMANPLNTSHAQSRSLPPKSKGALQVSTDAAQASAEDEQESKTKRMKGLGLAGVATIFQAVMSVCAKILGEFQYH